jgi:hypothetical protein
MRRVLPAPMGAKFAFTSWKGICILDGKRKEIDRGQLCRCRTTSPPSQEPTLQPSSTRAFRTAGLRTPTWFNECLPRPVMIFNGFALGL